MRIRPVDPRDTRWEISQPTYRVYYWRQQGPDDAHSGWASVEWEIEDADVDEVMSWARDNAGPERFVVYAKVVGGEAGHPGLVRLFGTDPLAE